MNTSANIPKNQLSRNQLELINRRTLGYPLPIAEKDYFLALAIQQISTSPLKKKLVFKGGTALHHCFLNQYRFSEDLDFTSIDNNINAKDIVSILESGNVFKAKKIYQSDFTIKIERLQYPGVLGQPGNIKVEIDYHQNVVLKSRPRSYNNVWQVKAKPLVMDPKEISAEKVRAISQRARYRDFYDLYFLLNELKIDIDRAIELLRKKEIRSPIRAKNIIKNWSVAKEQQDRELGEIYCSRSISSQEIENMITKINFEDIQ